MLLAVAAHRDQILDQFTRQAVPFSTAPSLRDKGLIELIVEASSVRADERVLDVACGPGLVVHAFAERAAHVVGIDIVPAMIERAHLGSRAMGSCSSSATPSYSTSSGSTRFRSGVTRHPYCAPAKAVLDGLGR